MSDTHKRRDRYHVEPTGEWYTILDIPYYRLVDTDRDEVLGDRMTRTAALACASRLNGRDMTPDQDRREGKR